MPGPEDNPVLIEALAALQAGYIKKLPGLRDELRQFLSSTTGESQQAARRVAHRLHGTAGSFGLEKVSACGATLEKLLRDQENVPAPSVIDEAFDDLSRAIDQLADTHPNDD